MQTVSLDFETFYSDEYSLRRMTIVEYVLDPRFQMIGCSVRIDNGPYEFLEHDQFVALLQKLDPRKTRVVSFNALFDMFILVVRYRFVPGLMIDTMGMARAIIGYKCKSLSLANVARVLGKGEKGQTVHHVKGMTASDIRAAGLWESYASYANNDNQLSVEIFEELKPSFPPEAFLINDMVLRMAVQPQFVLDRQVLAEHLYSVQIEKQRLLDEAGVTDKKLLMSNEKFAEVLRQLGVTPPMKMSRATGKLTYAFARSDREFQDLADHENPQVQAVVAARLGHKSTLEESRTERFQAIANLQWADGQSWFPIPLRYSGAHTHRLSGDWGLNAQNLPRGGKLRYALKAPPGYVVVSCDSAQVEARLTAWFCGQMDLVNDFAAGVDVYSAFASELFNRPVSKKENPLERFIGKTCILGLGYGMSAPVFVNSVASLSLAQLGHRVVLSIESASDAVRLYRRRYAKIAEMWRRLENMIPDLMRNSLQTLGPVIFFKESIRLPSGLLLNYHDLQYAPAEGFNYERAGLRYRLYGPKVLENLVQALAFITTIEAALRVRRRAPQYNLAHQVHDELIYVIKKEDAEWFSAILLEEMHRRPTWAPELPLAAELHTGESYGATK